MEMPSENENGAEREKSGREPMPKRRRLRLGKIIAAAFVLIALAIIATPISNVKDVDVVGNTKLSTNEILSIAKIEIDKTKIFFDKKKRIKKLLEEPYIKTASIEKKFFGKAIVKVAERDEVAFVKKGNVYCYVGSDGVYTRSSPKRKSLLLITGIAIAKAVTAKPLETENDVRFMDALSAYSALTKIKVPITKIDIGAEIPRLYMSDDFLIEGDLGLVRESTQKIKAVRKKLVKLKKTRGRIIVGDDGYFAYSPKQSS
jgi:cell division septal protein FtsQ